MDAAFQSISIEFLGFSNKLPTNTQEAIDNSLTELAGGPTRHHATLLHGVIPIRLADKVQVLLHQQHADARGRDLAHTALSMSSTTEG